MGTETNPDGHIDLEAIRQALLRDTAGHFSLESIDAVLEELLAHEFRDARVTSFLTILLHRAAREQLWSTKH